MGNKWRCTSFGMARGGRWCILMSVAAERSLGILGMGSDCYMSCSLVMGLVVGWVGPAAWRGQRGSHTERGLRGRGAEGLDGRDVRLEGRPWTIWRRGWGFHHGCRQTRPIGWTWRRTAHDELGCPGGGVDGREGLHGPTEGRPWPIRRQGRGLHRGRCRTQPMGWPWLRMTHDELGGRGRGADGAKVLGGLGGRRGLGVFRTVMLADLCCPPARRRWGRTERFCRAGRWPW